MRKKPQNLLTKPIRPGVYKCHWTGLEVSEEEMVLTSPIIPQCNGEYPAHPSYKESRKESYRLFCEFESNCNTCKHLERIPHPKGVYLHGICLKTNKKIKFCSRDHMGMDCYEGR